MFVETSPNVAPASPTVLEPEGGRAAPLSRRKQPRRGAARGSVPGCGSAAPLSEADRVRILVSAGSGDARWAEVVAEMSAAAGHLGLAELLARQGCPGGPGLDGVRDGLAVLHAVQLGLEALEEALRNAMGILGELAPQDRLDLMRRAALSLPALLPQAALPRIEALSLLLGTARRCSQPGEAAFMEAAGHAGTLARTLSAGWTALSRSLGGRA